VRRAYAIGLGWSLVCSRSEDLYFDGPHYFGLSSAFVLIFTFLYYVITVSGVVTVVDAGAASGGVAKVTVVVSISIGQVVTSGTIKS
jgi:hypothetical protein